VKCTRSGSRSVASKPPSGSSTAAPASTKDQFPRDAPARYIVVGWSPGGIVHPTSAGTVGCPTTRQRAGHAERQMVVTSRP
jgi:hypothetical protein